MSDVIHLLPDSVANQIAAGEVIQRPASVVKELVENAIDAGGDTVTIHVKDAGRTLIQVIDNGKGMSPTDARMSFERHATSKIREANDLFSVRTMGFRGEALASIASVAEVELRTRQQGEELGTFMHILGSVLQKQQTDHCPEGSNFAVKNLFFNVPARRKFLKSNSYELKNIITEVQRISLANPELAISFFHNQSPVYELPADNVRKRIVGLFGKAINQSLTPVEAETTLVKVSGFIGQPKFAKKSFGEQFFFVNGRFMKHPFFHRAVMNAYERILPPDAIPSYFLYLEVDPATIDINIHPTKTEIKFEDEQAIWHILSACIRESIGKYNLMPTIDFDQRGSIDIPIPPGRGSNFAPPEIEINRYYNPFRQESYPGAWTASGRDNSQAGQWEKLYPGTDKGDPASWKFAGGGFPSDNQPEENGDNQTMLRMDADQPLQPTGFMQLKNRYILTPVKSGLMVIDQREAHARILYENFMQNFSTHLAASQRQLFPPVLELNPADAEILNALREELHQLGFEIRPDADHHFYIDGTPGVLSHLDAKDLVESVIASFQFRPVDLMEEIKSQLALVLAQSSAVNYGVSLKQEEMSALFNQLFACHSPGFSPTGKKIVSIIALADIENLFKD
ncbi:MAG TPA: DNA mismatch repair endonuclease MutL [Prolixibacteraceae bacterium]|nr:DNA mismatch repair endonuclease MutL [Prolixibacteraceae bacterium]